MEKGILRKSVSIRSALVRGGDVSTVSVGAQSCAGVLFASLGCAGVIVGASCRALRRQRYLQIAKARGNTKNDQTFSHLWVTGTPEAVDTTTISTEIMNEKGALTYGCSAVP